MVQVSVQHASQGRPLANDSRPGMMPPMDSPLVAFGLAKPSFQVQIVSRQFIDRAQKQTRQKTCHQSHQVLGERVWLLGEVLAKFIKLTATVFLRAVSRIERIGNRLDFLHVRPQFGLNFFDGFQPTVNAIR